METTIRALRYRKVRKRRASKKLTKEQLNEMWLTSELTDIIGDLVLKDELMTIYDDNAKISAQLLNDKLSPDIFKTFSHTDIRRVAKALIDSI